MVEQICEFARLLRKHGARVSTAEAMDAVAAVAAVGVEDKAVFRAALAATLVKGQEDRAIFDELFPLYFFRFEPLLGGAGAEVAARGADGPDGPDGSDGPGRAKQPVPVPVPVDDALRALVEAAGITGAEAEELMRALASRAAALGAVARAGLGMRAPELALLVNAAGESLDMGEMRTPLQAGGYSYRLGQALGIGGAEAEALAMMEGVLAAHAARRGTLADEQIAALRGQVLRRFGQLRERLRAYVLSEFRRDNPHFGRRLTLSLVEDKPLAQLSEAELAEIRDEVSRLARKLKSRPRLRRHKTRGRLDIARTMRAAMVTGGVPFVLKRRRRQREWAELVVLCDISDSVAQVSRFMLQLVYTLHELFDRVESFAFVADLGELTQIFRHHGIEEALRMVYAGAAVSRFANSNYGRALEQFCERYRSKVNSRTTVIVIGDGRSNYSSPRTDLVDELRGRAKALWWITPESESMWGFGDSAMREYARYCDKVMVVRSLKGLRRVIDKLML